MLNKLHHPPSSGLPVEGVVSVRKEEVQCCKSECRDSWSRLPSCLGNYLSRLLAEYETCLLVHWLALMSEIQQWWISGRSRLECIAITTFLMHERDERVRKLLVYPAKTVGILLS